MHTLKNYSLSEVIELLIDYRGKTPKKLGGDWSSTGHMAISAKNIKAGKLVQQESIKYVDTNIYKKWMKEEIKRGDILITSEAPFGEVLFWNSDKKIVLSQRIFGLRTNKNFCSKYIYYYMRTPEFQKELDSRATGTTVTGLRQPELLKCTIKSPTLDIQKKIAGVLSALDDKIELNNQINSNLEQQAQALFKKYFINQFFPGTDQYLGNVCSCTLGGTPSRAKPEYWNGNIPWINSGEANKFRIIEASENITSLGLNKSATKLLPAKTTVIAITGATLGQVSLLEIPACTNQSLVGVIPNDKLPYEFIYPFIKNKIPELLSHQTGGAQQHINKQNVESLKIRVPDKDILNAYIKNVAPIYATITKNCFENSVLTKIRDSLLPKLMSGEIDVSKVDIEQIINNKDSSL